MAKIAVLGYGTVGSGVVEVLESLFLSNNSTTPEPTVK